MAVDADKEDYKMPLAKCQKKIQCSLVMRSAHSSTAIADEQCMEELEKRVETNRN